MSERDLQARRGGKAGADAWDDFDIDAGSTQRGKLLAGAAEHQRVTTFQPDHGLAGAGMGDHQSLDLGLLHAVLALRLADWNYLSLATGMLQHLGPDQAVVENHIGRFQGANRFERPKPGV